MLASHAETYGMVVTEALARGVPVLATDVGGVSEALGHGEDGTRPGLLVPPGDPAALGAALRTWLGDAALRERLRRAARERRASLRPWAATTRDLAAVLAAVGPRASSRERRDERGPRRPEWLDLREPADAAARSAELAELLARHLPAGRLVIHDLGGGSGAMGRWLAPRLPGPQHWVVHDRDADLLELAVADPPAASHRRGAASDITRLSPDDLAGATLVVASALLDMLTADELARMLGACAGLPMLLALTVVGRVALTPAEPLDAHIVAAFNAHQRRDGRLGPDAVAAAVDELARRGPRPAEPLAPRRGARRPAGRVARRVGRRRLRAGARAGRRGRRLPDRRLAQAAAGELAVTVDHADLLVLP